jgi:hypothetical protein
MIQPAHAGPPRSCAIRSRIWQFPTLYAKWLAGRAFEKRVAGRRWACHPVIGFDDPLDRRGCLGDLCRRSGRLAEPEAI